MRAATLLVMCAAGPIASAQERVAFPANTTPGVIDCGSWSWSMTDRGQCTTALSRPDGGGLYVGSESIAISGDVISCAAAGASNRGCVTTGTQTLAGAKTWSGAQTYSAAIDLQANSTVRGDLLFLAPSGGFFQQLTSNGAFRFIGNKSGDDTSAEFRIEAENFRDSGYVVDLYDSNANRLGAWDLYGNYHLTGPTHASGSYGQIIDDTGVPGHVTMTSSPGQAITILGKFNDPDAPSEDATLPDGGRTPDGGYYSFAGRHGEVTLGATWPRDAGMLTDWQNPTSGTGAYTDKKAFIDFGGGFGQAHGLPRAQFAQCPSDLVLVQQGGQGEFQYRYGHETSVLLWASDFERWYACLTGGWEQIPITDEVLTVAGGATTPKALDSGADTCSAGTRSVTFTVAFAVAPAVICQDITDYTQPCGTTSKNTTGATFACNASDAFNWIAVGVR